MLTGTAKRLAKVVAHLKYVWPEHRAKQYEERPSKKSRGSTEWSLIAVAKMSVKEFTSHVLEAGLIQDLRGSACPNGQCYKKSPGVQCSVSAWVDEVFYWWLRFGRDS